MLTLSRERRKERGKERRGRKKKNNQIIWSYATVAKVLGGRKAGPPQLAAAPALRLIVFPAGVLLSIVTYRRRFLYYF